MENLNNGGGAAGEDFVGYMENIAAIEAEERAEEEMFRAHEVRTLYSIGCFERTHTSSSEERTNNK